MLCKALNRACELISSQFKLISIDSQGNQSPGTELTSILTVGKQWSLINASCMFQSCVDSLLDALSTPKIVSWEFFCRY